MGRKNCIDILSDKPAEPCKRKPEHGKERETSREKLDFFFQIAAQNNAMSKQDLTRRKK